MRLHPARPRGTALLAAVALTTVGLAAPASATTTVGADDVCATDPTTRPVGVYELTAVEDNGVGIWAGGGLTVTTATELEGRVVVGGDADLSGAGTLNVGTAGGGGSAITPAGGTDMLVVGGDLATAASTQVGLHASRGGNVVVGGAVTGPAPSTESVHGPSGTVTQGVGRATALAPYADLPALAAGIAADAADGAVAATPTGGALTVEAGERYVLTADAAATLRELHVTGTGPVLLTVTGEDVSVPGLTYVAYDGVRVYQATQHLAAHFLWSFPDATHVRLGTNDQFPGTVVVPREDSTLTVATSTNGRVLANGAVAYTGGAGIEHHNYPFAGPCEATPLVEEPKPEPSPEGPNPGEGVTVPPTTTAENPPAEEPGAPTAEATPAAATGATPTAAATPTAVPTGVASDGGLATTGASVAVLAVVAALLLAAGATILVVARRRAAA